MKEKAAACNILPQHAPLGEVLEEFLGRIEEVEKNLWKTKHNSTDKKEQDPQLRKSFIR